MGSLLAAAVAYLTYGGLALAFVVFVVFRAPPGARRLYLACVVWELPGTFLRSYFFAFVVALPLLPIALAIGFVRYAFVLSIVAGILGAFPIWWSALALLGMKGGGDKLTRYVMRARRMSKREGQRLVAALTALPERKGMKYFSHVYVVNWKTPKYLIVGTTLYLGKPLLHEELQHLPAVLSQALSFVNTPDGRLILALRRLTFPPFYYLARFTRETAPGTKFTQGLASVMNEGHDFVLFFWGFLMLIGGGIGTFVTQLRWEEFWKERIKVHDAHAKNLGMAGGLIDYLTKYQLFGIAAPMFTYDDDDAELRIQELLP